MKHTIITSKFKVKIYLKNVRRPIKMLFDNKELLDKFYAFLIGPTDLVKFYDLIVNRNEILYIDIEEKVFKKTFKK